MLLAHHKVEKLTFKKDQIFKQISKGNVKPGTRLSTELGPPGSASV